MEYHRYDLNLSEIRMELKRLSILNSEYGHRENLDKTLEELDTMGEILCKQLKIDYKETTEKMIPIIASSTGNSYHVFLSLQLNFLDPFKIPNFLEYHYHTFKGNYYAQDNKGLVGVLEFVVYDKVRIRSVSEDHIRREKLMGWIYEKRQTIKNYPINFNRKTIHISSTYQDRLFVTLEDFFIPDERVALKVLINGNPIEGKVTFNGPSNRLLDLFRRFYDEGLIPTTKSNLQDWVCHFFQFVDNGKTKSIAPRTAHNVISSDSHKCIKPIPFNFKYLGIIS